MYKNSFTWQWIQTDTLLITVRGKWTAQHLERTMPLLNADLREIEHPYNVVWDIQNGILSVILNLIRSAREGDPAPEERMRSSTGKAPPDPQTLIFVHRNLLVRWILRKISRIENKADDAFTICKSVDMALSMLETQ